MEDYKKSNNFCCFRCIIEQLALTVIKLLRFFLYWCLLFFTRFHFFCTAVVYTFGLQTPITATCSMRSLLGNGSHHGNPISLDMSGTWWNATTRSFVQIGPLVGELQHFQHFPIWRSSAILTVKNFNIWSCDCHRLPNLLLCSKFHQNWFTLPASTTITANI